MVQMFHVEVTPDGYAHSPFIHMEMLFADGWSIWEIKNDLVDVNEN